MTVHIFNLCIYTMIMYVKHAFNQEIQHILYFTINGKLGEM